MWCCYYFNFGANRPIFVLLCPQIKNQASQEEEFGDALVEEIKRQLETEEIPQAQVDSIKPPLVRHDSVRSSVPVKESVTTSMSRSLSCLSVQSVSSTHSEQRGTPTQTNESSPQQSAGQEEAAQIPNEKVTESARKKVKKGLKKASSREVVSAGDATMSLEEVKNALNIPAGPLKDFVDLLWQENQMLKETVAKMEKASYTFLAPMCLCFGLTCCSLFPFPFLKKAKREKKAEKAASKQ